MAQNQFVNVTVDPSSAKKIDNTDHRHTVSQAAAAANDFTISLDTAKVTTMTIFDSAVTAARKIFSAQIAK